jgi:soluble lytic murein transglycosylase-like protein
VNEEAFPDLPSRETARCPICRQAISITGLDERGAATAVAEHIRGAHQDLKNRPAAPAEPDDRGAGTDAARPDDARADGERADGSTGDDTAAGPRVAGVTETSADTPGGAVDDLDDEYFDYGTERRRQAQENAERWRDRSREHDELAAEKQRRDQENTPVATPEASQTAGHGKDAQPGASCVTCGRPLPKSRLRPAGTGIGICARCQTMKTDGFPRGKAQNDGATKPGTGRHSGDQEKKGTAPSGAKDTAGKQAPKGVPSKEKKPDSALDKNLKKGAQAAAQSIGVPAPVAAKALESEIGGKLLKAAKRTPIALLVVLVLLATAVFGGALSPDSPEDEVWNVLPGEAVDIPEPYLSAYRNAANQYKIPWTILAAVGRRATNHGRLNPYETDVSGGLVTGSYNGNITKVYHYGDSLGGGVSPYLRSIFQQLGIEYVPYVANGKRIGEVIEEIENNTTGPARGAAVLVNIGNNDTSPVETFTQDMRTLLDDVSRKTSGEPVWWVSVDFPTRPLTQQYNSAIRELGAAPPDPLRMVSDLQVVDWESYAVANNIRPVDGVHLSGNGYREMARQIASSITGIELNNGGAANTEGALPTPTGTCPTLAAPIKGDTRTQGAGPLMLKPAALDAAGTVLGDGVQNICKSADALAEIIGEAARVVGEEQGLPFPSGIAELARTAAQGDAGAADRVHKFWAAALDRVTVLGDVEREECGFGDRDDIPAETEVGVMIAAHWGCALENYRLKGVEKVTVDPAGVVTYNTLSQLASTSRAVNEALSVAWTWSQWGQQSCDKNAAGAAGIFPMTKAVFEANRPEKYQDKNRCSWEANIATAAVLFATGESADPATRPGAWDATIGGWSAFTSVSAPATAAFDTTGPWAPLEIEQTCARVILAGLTAEAAKPVLFAGRTAAAVQRYISDGVPAADQPAVDAVINAIATTARADAACGTDRPVTEWYGAIAGVANGDYLLTETGNGTSTVPRITTGNTAIERRTGDVLTALAARAFVLGNAPAPAVVFGSTAMLQRLSPTRIEVPSRPALPTVDQTTNLSVGSQIINIAVGYYGGIFVNKDGRAIVVGAGLVGSEIPYAELFNSIGRELGVDPRILAAIAEQESNFNAESNCPYNGSGAAGMMQKEGDAVPTVCGDPERQIRIGAEMLLARFDEAGDWRGAFWGYNNGPVFSKEWKKLRGDVSKAEAFATEFYTKPGRGGERRAEIAMKYISDDPAVRSAWGAYLRYQQLYPTTVINSFQTTVLGSACPEDGTVLTQIRGKTLMRDGSDAIGFKQLCVDSVAAAPTPEAARAIIYIFKNLGGIYDSPRRNQNRFDCSGYMSKAYEYAGVLMHATGGDGNRNYFTTHRLLPHSWGTRPDWIVQVDPLVMQPGDLMFPFDGHVVMVLAHGYMAHSPATGDVNHVRKIYSTFKQVNRVVPELSPKPFEPLQVLS